MTKPDQLSDTMKLSLEVIFVIASFVTLALVFAFAANGLPGIAS